MQITSDVPFQGIVLQQIMQDNIIHEMIFLLAHTRGQAEPLRIRCTLFTHVNKLFRLFPQSCS